MHLDHVWGDIDTYPCVDVTFHDFGVCLCGKAYVFEVGFHRVDNIFKPLQELVVLTRPEIWELRSMLPFI